MKSYFDDQMRILQEDVKLFSSQYPEHAQYLNMESTDDRDPNVERLLEGFAYLTGRIQQQLDHGLMGVSEVLLEHLSPVSLLSIPSKAIAQYQVSPNIANAEELNFYSECRLASKKVGSEKTNCYFNLEHEETFYPIVLTSVYQKEISRQQHEVKLSFSVPDESVNFSMDSIKLYFDGEIELRLSWIYALFNQLEQAKINFKGEAYNILTRHPYLDDNSFIENDLFGVETLKDYFTFRDKFMFVELFNIPELTFSGGDNFEISFFLKEPIPTLFIKKDSVLLGCAPIINKFNHLSDPLNYRGEEYSSPFVVDSCKRKSMCLYQVKDVFSKESQAKKITFKPFSQYKKNQGNVVYYRIEKQRSLLDANRIILSGLSFKTSQVLSVSVLSSNGFYPRKYISIRELSIDNSTNLKKVKGTNITKPTNYFPAINKQEYYLQLVGILSESYKKLSDKNHLLNVLHGHDLKQLYKEKINAILKTKIEPDQKFIKGIIYFGVNYHIEIDECFYSNEKEIFLFGMLLHFFLLHHIEINHYLNTKIKFTHSEKYFSWHGKQGKSSRG